ncbi:MAG: hypothetical protein ACQESX_11465 [Bacteroidota bacterium]
MKLFFKISLVCSMLLSVAGISVLSAQSAITEDAFIKQTEVKERKIIYHIDFTQLSERYDKVRFVNDLYEQDDIIVTDNDLNSKTFSVSAYKKYPPEHIKALVLGLKASTERSSALKTSQQKKDWLKHHDKFQKKEK